MGRQWEEGHSRGSWRSSSGPGLLSFWLSPLGKGSAAPGLVIQGGICTAETAGMGLSFPGEQEVEDPGVAHKVPMA